MGSKAGKGSGKLKHAANQVRGNYQQERSQEDDDDEAEYEALVVGVQLSPKTSGSSIQGLRVTCVKTSPSSVS